MNRSTQRLKYAKPGALGRRLGLGFGGPVKEPIIGVSRDSIDKIVDIIEAPIDNIFDNITSLIDF